MLGAWERSIGPRTPKLGREIAIKLLLEEVSADPERLARFEREARVLASLNHNNIATLHGFESDGDTSFLVMELVEGETLAERIGRGSIPVDEAIPLFLQIAEGLEAAHENGVVHRDLKPANIKILEDGGIKILDFGLAKAIAPQMETSDPSLSNSPTLTLAATQRGEILGTAAYMSPEQAKGGLTDHRADIWAFGVCLYETLVGLRPFRADTPVETISKVLESGPDWTSLPPEAESLRPLLMRCLRRDPRQRLRHVADARFVLEDVADGVLGERTSQALPRSGTPARRSLIPGAALGLVAGLLAASALYWGRPEPESTRSAVRRTSIQLPEAYALRIPTLDFLDRPLTISPDGTWLVYVARTIEGDQLVKRRMDDFTAEPIPGTQLAWHPTFSPDGEWIAFQTQLGWDIKKVRVTGGTPIVLARSSNLLGGLMWNPDGYLRFTHSGVLWRLAEDGGDVESELDLRGPGTWHGFPALTAGGETLLHGSKAGDEATYTVRARDRATGAHHAVLHGGFQFRLIEESGHLVYSDVGGLRAVAIDTRTYETLASTIDVLSLSSNEGRLAAWHLGDDGTLAYADAPSPSGSSSRVVRVGLAGNEESIDLPLIPPYQYVSVSPDGRWVATGLFDIETNNSDIYLFDLAGETGRQRLTFHPDFDGSPVWSRDSQSVVFHSYRHSGSFAPNLYRKDIRGGEAERISTSNALQTPLDTHPDGTVLFLSEEDDGSWGVFTLSPGADEVSTLIGGPGDQMFASFSPDGRWVAYSDRQGGRDEIYVATYPDVRQERRQVSQEGGFATRWDPAGEKLFFKSGGRILEVDIKTDPNLRIGEPRLIFESPLYASPTSFFEVLPGGESFLVLKSQDTRRVTEIRIVDNFVEELNRLVPRE